METNSQRAKFARRIVNHKWLIVNVPVWDNGIRGISTEDFRYYRKRVNTALKNSRTKYWEKFNAVILPMEIQHPQFIPGQVHLEQNSQEELNSQVFSAASKVICEFCTWTLGKFVPAEHN